MIARRRSVGSSSASASAQVGAGAPGGEGEQVADEPEDVAASLGGRRRWYSTRSVKKIAPTRSLLRAAASASTAATSAPSSPLVRSRLPNPPDALRSTTKSTDSSRSSR